MIKAHKIRLHPTLEQAQYSPVLQEQPGSFSTGAWPNRSNSMKREKSRTRWRSKSSSTLFAKNNFLGHTRQQSVLLRELSWM